MELPGREFATVPKEKVVEYLLSSSHRDGRHKAVFFTRFGFTLDDWEQLAEAIVFHANRHDAEKVEETQFGARYVVDGIMQMPDGRDALVRTVWFIDLGANWSRFVTAYPLRRRDDD